MKGKLCVAILTRGWVFVGRATVEDGWCVLTDAKNVRRWGTTRGLGQLAKEGPQPNTKLDDGGTVRAPVTALVGLIDCEEEAWNKKYP